MLFFKIKFYLELTCLSNSHSFPWYILTWKEARLKKGEPWFCLMYQIPLGTSVDVERLVFSSQEGHPTTSTFLRASCSQWGRPVILCLLFCVIKMCWCNGHGYPALLYFSELCRCVRTVKSYYRSFVHRQPGVWLQGVPSPRIQPLHKQIQQLKCWYFVYCCWVNSLTSLW